jgi:hypothetical protein
MDSGSFSLIHFQHQRAVHVHVEDYVHDYNDVDTMILGQSDDV